MNSVPGPVVSEAIQTSTAYLQQEFPTARPAWPMWMLNNSLPIVLYWIVFVLYWLPADAYMFQLLHSFLFIVFCVAPYRYSNNAVAFCLSFAAQRPHLPCLAWALWTCNACCCLWPKLWQEENERRIITLEFCCFIFYFWLFPVYVSNFLKLQTGTVRYVHVVHEGKYMYQDFWNFWYEPFDTIGYIFKF